VFVAGAAALNACFAFFKVPWSPNDETFYETELFGTDCYRDYLINSDSRSHRSLTRAIATTTV
jgi:hypothetical protein